MVTGTDDGVILFWTIVAQAKTVEVLQETMKKMARKTHAVHP